MRQTPQADTRNRTCPACGSGVGTSSSRSGSRAVWSTIARTATSSHSKGQVRSRRGEDAAVLLVHGSRDPAAGGGADPPAGLAVRRANRTAREAGLLRHACRPHTCRRDARPRRRAARLRQRLPPPRFRARRGGGEPRDAAVPVSRLDVRARRPPPQGAAQRGGAGLPAGRARPRAHRGRHLGPVRLREHLPRPRAARAGSRLAAGAGRGARAGRRLARPPLALGGRDRGELEDRERELPRVLPLPGRASRVQRARRRLARGLRLSQPTAASRPSTARSAR